MPELKHHFRAGKMNKDLDERLVPNGEYRNAENIEISTSEGSDVGSVQNVIGNTKLVGKTYDKNTGILSATGWDDVAGAIDDLTGPICIGSIADTQNDKIYWFIATSDQSVSAIAEYEESTGVISPILVDKNSILNFSTNYKITGINVVEGMLLWTDNQTEPKKIKISKFKSGSTDFNTHTTITQTVSTISSHTGTSTTITLVQADPTIQVGMSVTGTNVAADTTVSSISDVTLVLSASPSSTVTGDLTFAADFTEDKITVIKLSPLDPPTLTMLASKRTGVGTGTNEPALTRYSFLDSDDVILPALTSITLSFIGDEPEYTNGDILTLTHTDDNDIEHEISVKIRPKNDPNGDGLITKRYDTTREAWVVSSVGVIIQNVPTTVPEGTLQWDVVLDEEEPLFENKFVRYAYRWKYKDGEYSCYSPFSDVAFIPGNFKYQTNTGFNEALINNLRFLNINIPGSKPPDVEEIDILYKESNNNLVYVADTLKENSDGTFPSLSYEVKSEIIGSVVEANQLLRPWDNVPKRAKSQEVTANRLLYGNYYQQYDIPKENLPNIETTVLPKKITEATQVDGTAITQKGIPAKSLKSQRTYQVGVVYRDAYGRETPVFSNKNSAKLIGKSYAEKVNSLQCQLLNDAPDWATHFKYFVKETANEYYNVALDRFYEAEDGNIWLSFPSCERNKVSDETYLTLKKKHNSQEFVEATSKYKVLDINNEAPEFITIKTKTVAVATCVIKSDSTDRPTVGTRIFEVRGPAPEFNDKFARGFTADASIRIITTGGTTRKYEVESGGPVGEFNGATNPKEIYRIALKHAFSSEDEDVLANTYLEANDEIKIELFEDKKDMKPEFFGKFFVKIQRDAELNTNIITSFPALDTEWSIVDSEAIYDEAQNEFRNKKWPVDGKTYYRDVETACWVDNVPRASTRLSPGKFKQPTSKHPTSGQKEFTFYYAGIDYGSAWRAKANDESICKDTNGNSVTGCEKKSPPDRHGGRAHNEVDNIKPFLEKMTEKGTVFSFTNVNGDEGANYEVTDFDISYEHRTTDQPVRREIRSKRRGYKIMFKTHGGDGGYEDPFLMAQASGTTGRINQINIKQENIIRGEEIISTTNPAIFETEPKEGIELDIYNEISGAYPIVRPKMKISGTGIAASTTIATVTDPNTFTISNSTTSAISGGTVTLTDPKGIYHFDIQVTASNSSTAITVDSGQTHGQEQSLDWFNCYSFGNGVESNRIRDDFNAIYIDKGPKVSTVLAEQYKEEHKLNGLIWSGIFNSTSSINRLNQFIMAEPITKDLNPYYGSIQKLHGRKSDLLTFCEDQVLTILANKDALYEASGNTQLTATNRVLGQSIPYAGEYGISKNPESFVSHANNVFWSDKARGVICNLQGQNVVPISAFGMTDWFKDNLVDATSIVGTYNQNKNSYNVTIKGTTDYTLSYDPMVKGWTSFKSFVPESGVSMNNKYYTYSSGDIWIHTNSTRNNFYSVQYQSGVTVLLNDNPEVIKGFKTLNYEGTDARKYTYAGTIGSTAIGNQTMDELMSGGYTAAQINGLTETATTGWYCNDIQTNEADGAIRDFKEKEGKWFNYLKGDTTTLSNIDSEEFSVQGIGQFASISGDTAIGGFDVTLTLKGPDSAALSAVGMKLTGVSGGSWVLDSDNDKVYWNDVTTSTNLNTLADPVLTLAPLDGYTLGTQAVLAESPSASIDGAGTWSSGNSTLTIGLDSHVLAADRNIVADITGGTVKTYSISGTYDTFERNTTTATSTNTAYTATAADGATSAVIDITFTAASGYYFPIDSEDQRPYVWIKTEDSDPDTEYTYTYTDTTSTMNVKGVSKTIYTARRIQVYYKHGAENRTGDKIIFNAINAAKKWVEKTEVNAITGLTADKTTVIPADGDTRHLNISATVGNTAPTFQLQRTIEYFDISADDGSGGSGWDADGNGTAATPKYLTDEGNTDDYQTGTWSKTPTTFTWSNHLKSSFYRVQETFGTLGNYPKRYTYKALPVVPGSLASDFTGDNPITLYQYKDVTLTSFAKDDPAVAKSDGTRILNYDVAYDASDGSTHKTQSASDTESYAALTEPMVNSGKDVLEVSHIITTRDSAVSTPNAILVSRDPTAEDFTFQKVNGVVDAAVDGSVTVILQEEIPAIVVGMIVTDEDEDNPQINTKGTETNVTVTAISGKTITLSSTQRIVRYTELTFSPPNDWEFDISNVVITKGVVATPVDGISTDNPTSPLYDDVTVTANYDIAKYGSVGLTSVLKTNKFLSFWDVSGTGSGGGTVLITLLAAAGNISSYGAMTGKVVAVGTTSGTTLSGTVVLKGNWSGNTASDITVGLMTGADGVAGFDPDSYSGDTVLSTSQFPGTGDGDDEATINWSVNLNATVLITTSLKLGFTVTLEETP